VDPLFTDILLRYVRVRKYARTAGNSMSGIVQNVKSRTGPMRMPDPGGCAHHLITACMTMMGTNPPSQNFHKRVHPVEDFVHFIYVGPARQNSVKTELQRWIPG